MLKFIPPILFALAGLFFVWLATSPPRGDLSSIFYFPAIACGIIAVLWGLIAWAL